MPQLTLKISHNIDITSIDFKPIFLSIHQAMKDVPSMDITTCHSGVIQEDYSYIGLGDERATKVYLELYWLESDERIAMKPALAMRFMEILNRMLTPQVEMQNLICIPRVRISNLGKLNEGYFISGK